MSTILENVRKHFGFDSIALRYEADEQNLDPDDEEYAEDYIQRRSAQIIGFVHKDNIDPAGDESDQKHNGEEYVEFELGHIVGYVFHFRAADNANVDIVMEADATFQDLYVASEVLSTLYEDWGGFRDGENTLSADAVYIHSLFLKPEYRGQRLGEFVLRRFIERHDPTNLFAVALQPAARSFFETRDGQGQVVLREEHKDDPLAIMEKRPAQKKLEAWYRTIGFKPAKVGAHGKGFFILAAADEFDAAWRYQTPATPTSKPGRFSLGKKKSSRDVPTRTH